MAVTVRDIVDLMELIAPTSIAEKWDNVGLQVGNPDWVVNKVWIALDPIKTVIAQACRNNVNMLVTHHPLLFKPLRVINLNTPLGESLEMAINNRLAVFAAHTNLDSAVDGLNDVLAEKIGLVDTVPLVPGNNPAQDVSQAEHGLGRIGRLAQPTDLKSLAIDVKKNLRLTSVKTVGDLDQSIQKVAVCTGSGSSLVSDFLATEAHTFISGDIRYHDAQDALSARRSIIDIGHFGSEHLIVDKLAERLSSMVIERNMNVHIEAFNLETDPFTRI